MKQPFTHPSVASKAAGSGAPARPGVRTALGWHELRDSGKLPNGTREVTVLIRPEQFALTPFASSSAASAGGVTGKVTEAR
jgi:hypothetical protein